MSPNEAQLRAFLHDGEGDVPDASSLISHATHVQYVRRRRIHAIAGGTAAVAVLATVTSLLVGLGSNGEQGGSSGGLAEPAVGGANHRSDLTVPGPKKHDKNAPGGASGSSTGFGVMSGTEATANCTPSPVHYQLPNSSPPNAAAAMFARSPNGITLCTYPSKGRTVARPLGVGLVHRLARIIETSPSVPAPDRSCPTVSPGTARTVDLHAVDVAGKPIRTIVLTRVGCNAIEATNGTAVRYLSAAPKQVLAAFGITSAGG